MGLGDASRIRRVFDAETLLHDTATAITSDDDWQVGGADKIYDLGADNAAIRASLIVDVSAIDLVGTDEVYDLILKGSTKVDFATEFSTLAILRIGHATAVATSDQTYGVGRYEVPFTNVKGDDVFRYLRGSVDVTGVTASITFTAWLARLGSRDL